MEMLQKKSITKEQAKNNVEEFHKDLRKKAWQKVSDSKIPDLVKLGMVTANALEILIEHIDRDIRAEIRSMGLKCSQTNADGDIEISPLKTVNDFYCEGKALHHCVFAMEYYKRKDSLILGAKVNGERTETIEVNLKSFSVSQCRGKNNMDSPYHKRIMSLMSCNLGRLKDMYRRVQ